VSPLRVGIVGARFAAALHAVNYRPLVGGKVELAAVCARTRSQAEAFAKHHAVARVFTDYRELCASPDVDVVDICSTTDTHHEVAIAAARAGKHVIVEKPLTGAFCEATEPRETMLAAALRNCDAVLDAVTKAGVTLCYAEDFVYAPPVAKLRRLMETDTFYYHGYTELYLEGRWVKATPAFDRRLCEKFGVRPLEFNGREDSLFHPYDVEGRRHMEYLRDRGPATDVPVEEILEIFRRCYPNLTAEAATVPATQFRAEAEAIQRERTDAS